MIWCFSVLHILLHLIIKERERKKGKERKNKKIIIKSDQIEFKGHYMEPPQKGYFMIKLIDWYENRAVINLYMLNIEASKRIKQK